LVLYPDIRPDDYPIDDARSALAEVKRLRPFFLGDHHLLLPLTAEEHDWCAYQFHRGDLNAGIALFFRRHNSPFPTIECSLKQIAPSAQYEVTKTTERQQGVSQRMSGLELQHLSVTIAMKPASQLLEYRKE
jgi:alpha-galactosidase